MAENQEFNDGYYENITAVRGARIWLGDCDETPQALVGLIAVKTRGKNYYFVQDSESLEYCAVHCPTFIKETAEKKLRKTRAKYLAVIHPELIQELLDAEENEDNTRATNVLNTLMKMLREKDRVGIETSLS